MVYKTQSRYGFAATSDMPISILGVKLQAHAPNEGSPPFLIIAILAQRGELQLHDPCEGRTADSNIAMLIESHALQAHDPCEDCARMQNAAILVESGKLDVHDVFFKFGTPRSNTAILIQHVFFHPSVAHGMTTPKVSIGPQC